MHIEDEELKTGSDFTEIDNDISKILGAEQRELFFSRKSLMVENFVKVSRVSGMHSVSFFFSCELRIGDCISHLTDSHVDISKFFSVDHVAPWKIIMTKWPL